MTELRSDIIALDVEAGSSFDLGGPDTPRVQRLSTLFDRGAYEFPSAKEGLLSLSARLADALRSFTELDLNHIQADAKAAKAPMGCNDSVPIDDVSPSSSPAQSPSPVQTFATFGEGTQRVGTDIAPGTYRTRFGSQGCYWARLRGFGGTVDHIIANNNNDYPEVVTIAKGDAGFESSDCDEWTTDLSRVSDSKTAIEPGTWIVGVDLKPGTYRTPGGDGCYWARLSGFSHELKHIIANDNPSGSAIVAISAADAGFSTVGCDTWTPA